MSDFAWQMGLAMQGAGNAAATAGSELVLSYASRFPDREDYEPLEQLAADVHRMFLETFADRFQELLKEDVA